MAPNEDPL